MNQPTNITEYRRRLTTVAFLLAALTTLTFWEVQYYDFTGVDDDQYVFAHEHVLAGLSLPSLRSAFTDIVAANWSPVTMLSLMLDTTLFGTGPGVYHRTALFLHVVNTVSLFLVLQLLTKALWPSAFVAALFALHPLHVEPVLWISSRKDVLSTLFWIWIIGAHAGYAADPNRRRGALIVFLYALALLTKPMVVTLPFVLLLLDYWPLNRYGDNYTITIKRVVELVKEKIPLFVLTFAFVVITYVAQAAAGAVRSSELVPWSLRIENTSPAYLIYIFKMFWPTNLSPVGYAIPFDTKFWEFAGATLVLALITGASVVLRKRAPYFPVGWLYFLGTMIPVIGIVTVGSALRTDRYTYVSFLGLFIIVAWGAADLARRRKLDRRVLAGAASVTIALCTVLTWQQIPHWQNAKTMFTQMLAVDSDNAMANYGIAKIYEQEGDYASAINHFRKVVGAVESPEQVLLSLGRAYYLLNDYGNAENAYLNAAKIDGANPDVFFGLGVAQKALRKYAEAERSFLRAVELDPTRAAPRRELEAVRTLRAGSP